MAGEPILIVDDNPTNLKLLCFLLAARGYEVRSAGTGEDALTVLDHFQPRLILVDLQLPGIDGLTLTRMLRERPTTREIAIVAVTAYAMQGDEQTALDAGCDGYITKPIDTRALPERVAHYLTLRSAGVEGSAR
jgi:CheY-like chemotaxis protein